MERRHWIMIACGAMIVIIAMGIRQSFGLFIQPLGVDLGVGRNVMGLAIAISNLMFGLAQPFVGAIADRYGAGRVIVGGSILYILGLLLMAVSTDPMGLYLTLGVLTGIGLAGTTYVVVLGAVGRAVPAAHRSRAFGLTTAAGSFGMFALVPGTQGLIGWLDWQGALVALAILVSTMIALSAGLAGKPQSAAGSGPELSIGQALKQAFGTGSYWLLNAGFFVCGFQVTFIAVHFQPYLLDQGIDARSAAIALAMIGLFNIAGSYLFGVLGDIYRKKYLLNLLYLSRAAIISLFLVLPLTPFTAIAFGSAIGFLWLATIPLTSGLVGQLFGPRYLSTLYGVVFLWHQVGSFLGAWLGGEAYEQFSSYDAIWYASIALGIIAGILHWPIRDEPVEMPVLNTPSAQEGTA
jgi:predicted MFS family arabinose efflux permease